MNTISSRRRPPAPTVCRRVTLALLFLAALAPQTVSASVFPQLVELTGQYAPGERVPGTSGLEAQISTYDLKLNVPVPLSKRVFLIPGLTFHSESISYPRAPEGFVPVRALYSGDLAMILAYVLTERWTLSLRGSAGIAGDLETLDDDALRWSGMVLATYSFGDRLLVGPGAMVSAAFGQMMLLPMVHAEWRPHRMLLIEGTLPYDALFTVRLGDRFEVGAKVDVDGNEYALRDPAIRATCIVAGGPCTDHLAYSIVTATALASVRLYSDLWLSIAGGHTLFRRFEEKDTAGHTLPGSGGDLPGVPILRAALVWRLPEH